MMDGRRVTSINDAAFFGYNNLTSVTIPDSMTSIGEAAFYSCSSLKNIYYGGDKNQWKEIDIGFNNDSLSTAIIHYNSTGLEN